MEQPLWMLVPWAVFSLAVAFKFWRFTSLVRRHLGPAVNSTERARQRLERLWRHDQQPEAGGGASGRESRWHPHDERR
jgi:hypothetical protein